MGKTYYDDIVVGKLEALEKQVDDLSKEISYLINHCYDEDKQKYILERYRSIVSNLEMLISSIKRTEFKS